MFVQATTPRPVFDPLKYPEHIFIHTLAKGGVSSGAVLFNGTTDPEHGTREGRPIEPISEYPIEGEDGFLALEYALPFWELFRAEDKKRNLKLVPFCTAGFGVVVKSAFRADFRTYMERTITFNVLMPVTGGGILRLADSFFDIANSTFDPYAALPSRYRNLEMELSYNRAHKLGGRSDEIDARRRARILEAETNMRDNARRLGSGPQDVPRLEGGTYRLPPKPIEEE